ncbi:hypothetical protein Bca52824_001313 [Brassica carinata]|uniref:Uncharacterized protein n=1 Tax=Brassica carinata TaxID=52824 RepID=A0A8X7WL93_BRACI|nr:hypothetical protein Bca52824_001313 [Brassica carinata]
MEEHCMVICGDWVCGSGNKWDFVIDKNKLARVVRLYDGIGLLELQESVLREFKLDGGKYEASLTYWPPSSSELATGITTPPVLLTNDGVISFFIQHLRVKGAMNLFVRFDEVLRDEHDDNIDDTGMGFVTPASTKQKSAFSAPPRFRTMTP